MHALNVWYLKIMVKHNPQTLSNIRGVNPIQLRAEIDLNASGLFLQSQSIDAPVNFSFFFFFVLFLIIIFENEKFPFFFSFLQHNEEEYCHKHREHPNLRQGIAKRYTF